LASGGIDGDLGAHRPVGMFKCIRGGDVSEFFNRPIAKRAAGGGEDDAGNAGGWMSLETLENSVVLAVHGQEFHAVFARGGDDEFAGEHEDFLGGERERLAGFDRGERGAQSGRADNGDEHCIRFGDTRELHQTFDAAEDACAARKRVGSARFVAGGFIVQCDGGHAEFRGDGCEFLPVGASGDRDELEFVGVRCDDAQGVLADGAGGS